MNRDPVERIRLKIDETQRQEEARARALRHLANILRRPWSYGIMTRVLLFIPLLVSLGLAGFLATQGSPNWGCFLFVAFCFGMGIAESGPEKPRW